MFDRLWRGLKVWRRLGIGPISLVFRLDRTVRVTPGLLKVSYPQLHPRPSASGGGSRGVRPASDPSTAAPLSHDDRLAIIIGVGPGLGFALARQLGEAGFDLVLVSRDANRLHPLVHDLHSKGVTVASHGADATDEVAVAKLFDRIEAVHGTPTLVVYAVQYSGPGAATEIELPAFETAWRHNCLGAFLVARRAARMMLSRGSGTIVFVGSTSSLLGRAGYLNLAVGKFGQRAIAQVMARELWPKGIHVAHAVIDADISEDPAGLATPPQADPQDIAAAILALHNQPKTAWTSELDLRPWNETFWEHC
jgi:NAD(P)-dependent dehydrogenase (short-subunit alcohol dehydrogenase family)